MRSAKEAFDWDRKAVGATQESKRRRNVALEVKQRGFFRKSVPPESGKDTVQRPASETFVARVPRLGRIPAEALALFFIDFFQQGEGLRAAILGASSENSVYQCHRSGV